ncbi:MAG: hypothetical protein ABSA66_12640 [Roseiarcus sp.]|jgi:hypothetical protein
MAAAHAVSRRFEIAPAPRMSGAKFLQAFPRQIQAFPRKFQTFPSFFQGIPRIFLGGFQRNQRLGGRAGDFALSCSPRGRNPLKLNPRSASSERSSAAADAEALADFRFQATTNSVFPEGNVAGITVAAHVSRFSSATAMESSCGDS